MYLCVPYKKKLKTNGITFVKFYDSKDRYIEFIWKILLDEFVLPFETMSTK